jgi:thioredoxin reductase
MQDSKVTIIGAGPARLAAGFHIAERQIPGLILEQDDQMGGLCKIRTSWCGFDCLGFIIEVNFFTIL